MANSEKKHVNLAGVTTVGGSGSVAKKKIAKAKKHGSMARTSFSKKSLGRVSLKEGKTGKSRPPRSRR